MTSVRESSHARTPRHLRRRRHLRPPARVAGLTAVALVTGTVGLAVPAVAATGDFSLDFVAAAPGSYDHLTGGGAYDDRTIGKNADVVESLEGGDFQCGDIVTYFLAIEVDDTAAAGADDAQTIDLGFQFLMDTTGQSGVAIGDITYVGVNYGPVEDLIAGQNTVDDGIADDGGSTATLTSESMTGQMFEPGGVLNGTVRVTDLERGETVIVRIDTQLYCQAPANPTGNLQADLSTAQLVFIDTDDPATGPTAIPGGAQTIPFKQFGGLQYPEIALQKTVATTTGVCPGVETRQVQGGETVRYCYVVTNAGDAPLYDLTVLDDHATPSVPGDDFAVTLTSGLSDQDEDGFADDLAAGGTASGFYDLTLAAGLATGTYTNTATARGEVAVYLGSEALTDTDTASVTVVAAPAIDIQKTPDAQTVVHGQTATFTIVVTNTGNVPLTAVTVTDPLAPGCAASIGALAVGGTSSYTCTLADVTSSFTNTATVTGMYGTTQVTDADTADVTVDLLPSISVLKTGTPTSVPETGADVLFTYTVTNDAAEPGTITSLEDDRFGTLDGDADCAVGTVLLAGASCSFSATFAIPAGDHPGSHVDVFTAVVTDAQGNTDDATDDETITYTDVLPDITVTKTGSPTSVPETGGDVLFTFVVTNASAEAATITALSDDQFGTLVGDADCAVGTVLPGGGGSCTFSQTFAIPAGDVPGSHVDVFTATVTDGDGNTDSATDDETITYTDVLPDITVTKTPGVSTVPETGGDVTFTYVVTNAAAEAATITVLTDDRFGSLVGDADCQVGTVLAASGGSCSFQATFAIPAGDVPGSHVNVFTATATDGDDNTDTATDDATVTYTDVAPTIEVTKTPSTATVPETGDDVTFTFTVKNTSALEAVTILSLEDDVFGTLDGDADCAVGTVLAVGATCTFTGTWFIAGDFGGAAHENLFTAVAEDDEGTDATDDDDATVGFTDVAPTIEVTKTADPTSVPETGGDVTFSFTVTNTGSEAVTILSLEDDVFGTLAGDADCQVGTVLASDASCSFSITERISGNASGPAHVNEITVVAEDDDGTDATDTDDAMVYFTDVAPAVVVTKTANPTSVPETGADVTFTFTVQNTSTAEAVTIMSLTDDIYGTLLGDLDCMVGTVLAAGATCSFSITRWVAGDVGGPDHVNTFTGVVQDDDGTPATDTDDATVTFTDVAPVVRITKTANPTSVLYTGGDVTFTFLVENIGTVSMTLTTLTDTVFGDLDGQGSCDVPQAIAVGGSYSCAITRFLSSPTMAPHTNVATATGVDDDGTTTTDDDDATVTFWSYGRTPGYWKNHPEVWTGATWTTYSPSTTVASVFTIPSCLLSRTGTLDLVKPAGQDTLLQALGYKGGTTTTGKAEILLRAATAALLNEQYYGDGYPPYATSAELIAAVNAALATCNGGAFITLATQLDNANNGNHAVRP